MVARKGGRCSTVYRHFCDNLNKKPFSYSTLTTRVQARPRRASMYAVQHAGNFRNWPPKVKETLYLSNIRPILEYACVLWDPQAYYLRDDLERAQNRAASFVTGNYVYTVRSSILKDCLGWQPLKCRRFALSFKLFHNIYNNKTGINRGLFLQLPHLISRTLDHQNKVYEYSCRTNIFKHSFFPLTTHQWNCLLESLVIISSNIVFYSRLIEDCLYLISCRFVKCVNNCIKLSIVIVLATRELYTMPDASH
ncbi:uncharacterized protein LOC120836123 [Ixodes scapularis]|uniref:uncharacterized protein LOC120836123 n=1 Tax=Ixodes scapularis TaxID=6945 RepID=UPI001A9D1871|nr:uncharacterized protein LOC120836123 [Ixodes scapularis]